MKITTNHPASNYGQPVILDDKGQVMDYGKGVKAVRAELKMSTKELGEACGTSHRTVENWEQGRVPRASALNVMADLLSLDALDKMSEILSKKS